MSKLQLLSTRASANGTVVYGVATFAATDVPVTQAMAGVSYTGDYLNITPSSIPGAAQNIGTLLSMLFSRAVLSDGVTQYQGGTVVIVINGVQTYAFTISATQPSDLGKTISAMLPINCPQGGTIEVMMVNMNAATFNTATMTFSFANTMFPPVVVDTY